MSNKIIIAALFLACVCCSVSFWGCAKKNIHDLVARMNPGETNHAVLYEVNLRAYSDPGAIRSLEAQILKFKTLGCTVLSLSPIHPIGELNRMGLLGNPDAVKDFYAVNPEFGTLEDVQTLVRMVHQNGLKIILNLAIRQAAWDSQILMEHPEWFVHNDEGAIVSPSTERSDVALLDFHQHELRKYIIAMMKYWVQDIGFDGFQCKAAEEIPTDFWEIARNELEKIKPVLLISEGRLPEHHLNAFDMTCSWDIDKTIADIGNGIAPATVLNDSLLQELMQYPKGSLHVRFLKELHADIEEMPVNRKSDLRVEREIAMLAFAIPGVPCIEHGIESGTENGKAQWSTFYEGLSAFRRNHPALQAGGYRTVQNSESSHIFSFIRYLENDSVLVVVNVSTAQEETDVRLPDSGRRYWKDQFSGVEWKAANSHLRMNLKPFDCFMMVPSSGKAME